MAAGQTATFMFDNVMPPEGHDEKDKRDFVSEYSTLFTGEQVSYDWHSQTQFSNIFAKLNSQYMYIYVTEMSPSQSERHPSGYMT